MRHQNLTHANLVRDALLAKAGVFVSREQLEKISETASAKTGYRLSTFVWEVEKKLGFKVERQRDGKRVTAYRIVIDKAKAKEMLKAKKKAEKDAAKLAAKSNAPAKKIATAAAKPARVRKPKVVAANSESGNTAEGSTPPTGSTNESDTATE